MKHPTPTVERISRNGLGMGGLREKKRIAEGMKYIEEKYGAKCIRTYKEGDLEIRVYDSRMASGGGS